jgi:phosphatidylinositol alpha-1,6-mannosyltransferase
VIDGETGLRVDGEKLGSIIDALHRLLANDALRAALGRNGLHRAQREFTWQRVAEKTKTGLRG